MHKLSSAALMQRRQSNGPPLELCQPKQVTTKTKVFPAGASEMIKVWVLAQGHSAGLSTDYHGN